MTALPAEGVLTWDAVHTRTQELLGGHPPGSAASASGMEQLCDEVYGRQILGPDGRLVFRIDHLDVKVTPAGLSVDVAVGPPVNPCPECTAGKHDNCDGRTWDTVTDDYTPCPCAGRGHP